MAAYNKEKSRTGYVNDKKHATCVTSDGFVALIKTLRRQPLDNEDGGTGSVNAEDEDQTP